MKSVSLNFSLNMFIAIDKPERVINKKKGKSSHNFQWIASVSVEQSMAKIERINKTPNNSKTVRKCIRTIWNEPHNVRPVEYRLIQIPVEKVFVLRLAMWTSWSLWVGWMKWILFEHTFITLATFTKKFIIKLDKTQHHFILSHK